MLTPPDNWVTVPTNSTVTIHKQTVLIHPVIDDFYIHEPSHQRSAQLACEQGQMSTRPNGVISGEATPMRSASQSKALAEGITTKLRELVATEA